MTKQYLIFNDSFSRDEYGKIYRNWTEDESVIALFQKPGVSEDGTAKISVPPRTKIDIFMYGEMMKPYTSSQDLGLNPNAPTPDTIIQILDDTDGNIVGGYPQMTRVNKHDKDILEVTIHPPFSQKIAGYRFRPYESDPAKINMELDEKNIHFLLKDIPFNEPIPGPTTKNPYDIPKVNVMDKFYSRNFECARSKVPLPKIYTALYQTPIDSEDDNEMQYISNGTVIDVTGPIQISDLDEIEGLWLPSGFILRIPSGTYQYTDENGELKTGNYTGQTTFGPYDRSYVLDLRGFPVRKLSGTITVTSATGACEKVRPIFENADLYMIEYLYGIGKKAGYDSILDMLAYASNEKSALAVRTNNISGRNLVTVEKIDEKDLKYDGLVDTLPVRLFVIPAFVKLTIEDYDSTIDYGPYTRGCVVPLSPSQRIKSMKSECTLEYSAERAAILASIDNYFVNLTDKHVDENEVDGIRQVAIRPGKVYDCSFVSDGSKITTTIGPYAMKTGRKMYLEYLKDDVEVNERSSSIVGTVRDFFNGKRKNVQTFVDFNSPYNLFDIYGGAVITCVPAGTELQGSLAQLKKNHANTVKFRFIDDDMIHDLPWDSVKNSTVYLPKKTQIIFRGKNTSIIGPFSFDCTFSFHEIGEVSQYRSFTFGNGIETSLTRKNVSSVLQSDFTRSRSVCGWKSRADSYAVDDGRMSLLDCNNDTQIVNDTLYAVFVPRGHAIQLSRTSDVRDTVSSQSVFGPFDYDTIVKLDEEWAGVDMYIKIRKTDSIARIGNKVAESKIEMDREVMGVGTTMYINEQEFDIGFSTTFEINDAEKLRNICSIRIPFDRKVFVFSGQSVQEFGPYNENVNVILADVDASLVIVAYQPIVPYSTRQEYTGTPRVPGISIDCFEKLPTSTIQINSPQSIILPAYTVAELQMNPWSRDGSTWTWFKRFNRSRVASDTPGPGGEDALQTMVLGPFTTPQEIDLRQSIVSQSDCRFKILSDYTEQYRSSLYEETIQISTTNLSNTSAKMNGPRVLGGDVTLPKTLVPSATPSTVQYERPHVLIPHNWILTLFSGEGGCGAVTSWYNAYDDVLTLDLCASPFNTFKSYLAYPIPEWIHMTDGITVLKIDAHKFLGEKKMTLYTAYGLKEVDLVHGEGTEYYWRADVPVTGISAFKVHDDIVTNAAKDLTLDVQIRANAQSMLEQIPYVLKGPDVVCLLIDAAHANANMESKPEVNHDNDVIQNHDSSVDNVKIEIQRGMKKTSLSCFGEALRKLQNVSTRDWDRVAYKELAPGDSCILKLDSLKTLKEVDILDDASARSLTHRNIGMGNPYEFKPQIFSIEYRDSNDEVLKREVFHMVIDPEFDLDFVSMKYVSLYRCTSGNGPVVSEKYCLPCGKDKDISIVIDQLRDNDSIGPQMSNIRLLHMDMNGVISNQHIKSIENPDGKHKSNETAVQLLDNDVNTKWLDIAYKEKTPRNSKLVATIDSENGYVIGFEADAANDEPGRDPVRIKISDKLVFSLVEPLHVKSLETRDSRETISVPISVTDRKSTLRFLENFKNE